MHSFLKRFVVALVFALSLPALCLTGPSELPSSSELTYSKQQSETTIEVVYRLYATHFNKQVLDDELSQAFLEKYLESLDPGKMFFYRKDIDAFNAHAKTFDNDFQAGNLDTVFEIYRVYQQRVESRLEAVLTLLEDDTVIFRFDEDEPCANVLGTVED